MHTKEQSQKQGIFLIGSGIIVGILYQLNGYHGNIDLSHYKERIFRMV